MASWYLGNSWRQHLAPALRDRGQAEARIGARDRPAARAPGPDALDVDVEETERGRRAGRSAAPAASEGPGAATRTGACRAVTGSTCAGSPRTSSAAPQSCVSTGVPSAFDSANTRPKVSGMTKLGKNVQSAVRASAWMRCCGCGPRYSTPSSRATAVRPCSRDCRRRGACRASLVSRRGTHPA